jgi:hypothetical protein
MSAPIHRENAAWRRRAGWLTLALVALVSAPAHSAEVTDVLDAFDRDNPYDLSLRVRFDQDSRAATIAREVRCIAADQVGGQLCPGGSRTILARELEYSSSRQIMNIDARIGVYHDVELFATFPVVLGYAWEHQFASGVTRSSSTLLPPDDRDAVVAVPYKSRDRGGFGDMSLGLRWAPFNYYRDPSKPTWVFGVTWTLPTGTPMSAETGNKGVGLGLHQLDFHTVISRRALRILEPFVGVHATLFFESEDSLFRRTRQAQTQRYVTPGSIIGTRFGGELIPWEDRGEDARVELEAGFSMDYHFRGRGYSELWEALASPLNPCRNTPGCNNVTHSMSAADADGQLARTNGLTDIEQFGRFTGWAGLHYQPVRHFQVSAMFRYAVETPHFITFGDIGVDLDGKGGVQQSNKNQDNEFSPVYLPGLDAPGGRVRVQDVTAMSFMLAISGKL